MKFFLRLFLVFILICALTACKPSVPNRESPFTTNVTQPTSADEEIDMRPIISLDVAEGVLPESGKYHHWIADESEYMVQIMLRCNQTLTDATLYEIIITEDADELSMLCTIANWGKELPIVADVAFPGDMSSYALCVTDQNDTKHWFCIYQSGKDGEICLGEYTPTT